jgi:hypothetical protein
MNGILVLAVLLLCAVAFLGILEFYRSSRAKKMMSEELAVMHRLQNDVHALCIGAINMGKHIDALEQRVIRLAERQDQLELRDPFEQTYAHAIRLAQKGADIEQLVEECGLARGEAELLLRIHRARHAQAASA